MVQYFQNRDVPENQEDEVWQKMAGAGPKKGVSPSPPPGGSSKEMSRENSRETPAARPDQFANPVSHLA